ncbi:oxygenase MpaB family protein [Tunicatimonas pelagia]|uniref:oxygenase MpaB family protein n=1 Tax=Tunicatimonas pelagia TaxID=931531 RepID=UPI0026671D54|nr:oxygenase MpaB family protein [Tunicatimonas pelagia]WKN43837.1 oxygenase MpaB family protein [Tunicatimonas pelagia]
MSKITLYNDQFLDEMRLRTDPIADEAVADLMRNKQAKQYHSIIQSLTVNNYQLPTGLPDSVVYFLETTRQLPEWVDFKLMQRGQQFLEKHISDLLLMLGLLSLPFDYASADGAQVLYRSERLRKNPAKRLAETGQYVLDVGEKNGFSPQGKAICSAQKVRLVHATIRYHIQQKNDWNEAWGQPVNQEDMAGTNLSFSVLPIRGLRKIGIEVSQEEAHAYIHLWNVANYTMGVDEPLLPDTTKEAFWLLKKISERQHAPSKAGQELTKSLLTVVPNNTAFDGKEIAARYMRFLLGDTIADILDLPSTSLPDAWLAAPLLGFVQFRQLLGNRAQQYYAVRQQLKQQLKQSKGEPFKLPSTLNTLH